MRPKPARYSAAQAIPPAGLCFCQDRTRNQQVGLVRNAEFVRQESQRQKQVRRWGGLRGKGEVAKQVGSKDRADLKPEGNGVLVARADRRIQPQCAGLTYTQNNLIAFPSAEQPGQGLVDERRLAGLPTRKWAIATLETYHRDAIVVNPLPVGA